MALMAGGAFLGGLRRCSGLRLPPSLALAPCMVGVTVFIPTRRAQLRSSGGLSGHFIPKTLILDMSV